jgi:hypothetical protein
MPDLETTNWLLGAIALASLVQTGLLVAAALAGLKMYRQVSERVEQLEANHVAPLRRQVDGILTDVQAITARFNNQTARVDHAITDTIDRVDETAERMKYRVRDKVSRATGVVRGLRAAIASLLTTEPTQATQEGSWRTNSIA